MKEGIVLKSKIIDDVGFLEKYYEIFCDGNILFLISYVMIAIMIFNVITNVLLKLGISLIHSLFIGVLLSALSIGVLLIIMGIMLNADKQEFKKGFYESEEYTIIGVKELRDDSKVGNIKIGTEYLLEDNNKNKITYLDKEGILKLNKNNKFKIRTKDILLNVYDESNIDLDAYININKHSLNYQKRKDIINVIKM